jgi:hypothetical protein
MFGPWMLIVLVIMHNHSMEQLNLQKIMREDL